MRGKTGYFLRKALLLVLVGLTLSISVSAYHNCEKEDCCSRGSFSEGYRDGFEDGFREGRDFSQEEDEDEEAEEVEPPRFFDEYNISEGEGGEDEEPPKWFHEYNLSNESG